MSIGIEEIGHLAIPYSDTPGVGSPVQNPNPIRDDPSQEYVSGGEGFSASQVPHALTNPIDDVTRDFGYQVYDSMLADPAGAASVMTLKLGILSGGMQLIPTDPTPIREDPSTPEEIQSAEMVDFCQRIIDRQRHFTGLLLQGLDCVAYGNKLAEIVFDVPETGELAGQLVPVRIKIKPRHAWKFVVDPTMEVLGILVRNRDGLQKVIRRDKFMVFTWMPRDHDPRGRSIFRAAYDAFNLKKLIYPQYYKYLKQFAAASLIGKLAPDETDRTPVDDDGLPITGAAKISPQVFMMQNLIRFQNGSVLVIPDGADVVPIPPQGDGTPFLKAFDYFNQEMVYGMLLQTRATREAEYGSKADSQTGQDILGMLINAGREMLSDVLRNDLFHTSIALNYGREVADRFTPYVSFGGANPEDRPTLWNAVANLKRANYLTPSMEPELDALVGLPIRMPGEEVNASTEPAVPVPGGDVAVDNEDPEETQQ